MRPPALALRGEASYDLKCRWYRYNGKELWVSLSLFPIYETPEARALNKVDLIQVTAQDITASKEAETVLKRDAEGLQYLVDERTAALSQAVEVLQKEVSERKRAQEANTQLEKALRQAQKLQAVGQLTAGIAHNFNNMLMVILGNIGIALRSADEQMRPSLQDSENTALKAAEMVKQLLTFSRRGEVAEQDTLDTKAIIEDIAAICRKTFDRQIDIETQMDTKLPVIIGDASQLEQVFLNLCLNSRNALHEASPKKPRITLEAPLSRNSDVTESPVQKRRRGKVADNGAGMNEETRERVFEPFFTTKEAGKGTGLGLATAYAIVDQHRGWMEVESQSRHRHRGLSAGQKNNPPPRPESPRRRFWAVRRLSWSSTKKKIATAKTV
jgi:signal transduction histidine kinase